MCDVVRSLVADDVVAGVHDLADGGLAGALAEMVASSATGAVVTGLAGHGELFGEGPSRVLVCVEGDGVGEVERRCRQAGTEVTVVGRAGGDRLVVDDVVDLAVADVVAAWRRPLPEAFAPGVAAG